MTRWILFLLAIPVAAHDLEVTSRQEGPAMIVRAAYAGTDACSYASVLVFPPGEALVEFQNGRTDANGMFAFVPDRAGSWTIYIDDEMGHRKDIKAEVVLSRPAAARETSTQPLWQKAVTGVALIAGLTGVLYGWKSRRPG